MSYTNDDFDYWNLKDDENFNDNTFLEDDLYGYNETLIFDNDEYTDPDEKEYVDLYY